MYREKIQQLGSAALARHGTDVSACSPGPGSWGNGEYSESCVSVVSSFQLWIDNISSAPSHSPEKKDSDFFSEHTQVSARKERFPQLFLTGGLLTEAKAHGHGHGFHSPWCDTSYRECLGPTAG